MEDGIWRERNRTREEDLTEEFSAVREKAWQRIYHIRMVTETKANRRDSRVVMGAVRRDR